MAIGIRIAAIEALSAAELRTEWQRRTDNDCPPAFGPAMLARALAYELQARARSGLSKADLKRLASFGASGKLDPAAGTILPGTWLSRTWHGEVHQVVVLDHGFEYRGERFSSLSEIARRITGTHWSGPRFFGLKSPRVSRLGSHADGR